MEELFKKISVTQRLPEKPKQILGGQQVNSVRPHFGDDFIVFGQGDQMTIAQFCYSDKQWYVEWDTRRMPTKENARNITSGVEFWLEKISATDAQQIIRNHDDLYKAIEKIEQGSPQTAKKFIERFINTVEE